MLGSVYCSIISFLAWRGVGGAHHHSMIQDRLPALRNGEAFISVDHFEIGEADVLSLFDKDDSERKCVLDFTSEEERRFETRYKEGYDLLYDSRYLAWLRHHHPESVHTLDNDVPSIVDASPHVPLTLMNQSVIT